MSAFAAVLRGVYRLVGAKKVFGLPEHEIRKVKMCIRDSPYTGTAGRTPQVGAEESCLLNAVRDLLTTV